jgi:endonuclease/exonuclease/phosphatase family metal-dependent hydrolase
VITLATFNVLDLLEPSDERERAILPAKLDALARTLRRIDADVVGLQEVGPPALLDAVLERLPRLGGWGGLGGRAGGYLEPVVGTPDARGIRNVLLSRLPLLHAQVHTAESLPFPAFRQGDPPPFGARIPLRRGVVHARVDAPAFGPLDVLVVHFKSPHPVPLRDAAGVELPATTARARAEAGLRSIVWRAAEALHVRGLVDDVLAGEPPPEVVVMGDMNDVPDSPVLRALRGEGERGRGDAAELFDCAAGIEPARRFSIVHGGRRVQIDHLLATAGLHARLAGAGFENGELREVLELPSAVSDHAALVTRFG